VNSREPAEFVREMLRTFPLQADLDAASLIDKMLAAPETDPWSLELTEEEHRLLGQTLAENPERPTIEETQSAIAWVGRRRLARHAEQLIRDLRSAEARNDAQAGKDPTAIDDLLLAKKLLGRATRDLEGF
jgi:hypothetical protein